jgi:AcrR family transcriptional regulator
VRVRVVDAALRCLAGQGLRKTTVDDIARAAGLSRATLYRNFPGGRDAVLVAATQTEVARLFAALAVELGAADDLEAVVVAGLVTASRRLGDHPALARLLAHEPEVVLPWLAFDGLDRVLGMATAFIAPFFGRWLAAEPAAWAAEWTTRVLLSFLTGPAEGVDLRRPEDARRLARRFVVPGIEAMAADAVADQTTPLDQP